MEITSEFKFTLDCCRDNFSTAGSRAISPPRGLDWARVLRLARFHRVQGLMWEALSPISAAVPEEVARALAADAKEVAAANLQAAAECRGLKADFEAAGVPLLFIKGLALGALAYGRSSIKAASDIDLLVPGEELDRAAALLGQRGYKPVIPEQGLQRWHRHRKESVWEKAHPALFVDLHTRLADSRRLIPTIGIGSPRQMVEVARGIKLPTLGHDELFTYLAVHGASSAWFRLKWITDFAALVAGHPAGQIEALYRRSQELGAGRAAAQALLLAGRLYATLSDVPELERELGGDRASRWLAQAALRQVAGSPEPVDPTSVRWGTATIHATQLLLLPGVPFKASELLREVRYRLA